MPFLEIFIETAVGVSSGTWTVTGGIVNFFFFDTAAPFAFAALPVPASTALAFSFEQVTVTVIRLYDFDFDLPLRSQLGG